MYTKLKFKKIIAAILLSCLAFVSHGQSIPARLRAKTLEATQVFKLKTISITDIQTIGSTSLTDNKKLASQKYIDSLNSFAIINATSLPDSSGFNLENGNGTKKVIKFANSGNGTGVTNLDVLFTWGVLDSLNAPPAAPDTANIGDKFLVGTAATGLFIAHENQIATYNSNYTWSFQNALTGDLLLNVGNSFVLQKTNTGWIRLQKAVLHAGGDTYGQAIYAGTNDAHPFTLRSKGKDVINMGVLKPIQETSTVGPVSINTNLLRIGANAAPAIIQLNGTGSWYDQWNATWSQGYESVINFGTYTSYADFRINGYNNIRLFDYGVQIGKQSLLTKGLLSIGASNGAVPSLHFDISATLLDSARVGGFEPVGNDIYYTGTDSVRKKLYGIQVGTATLVSGTVTVSDTRVKTGAIIFVSVNTPSGTQGFLSAPIASIVNNTSFVINSTSGTENSTIIYQIIIP